MPYDEICWEHILIPLWNPTLTQLATSPHPYVPCFYHACIPSQTASFLPSCPLCVKAVTAHRILHCGRNNLPNCTDSIPIQCISSMRTLLTSLGLSLISDTGIDSWWWIPSRYEALGFILFRGGDVKKSKEIKEKLMILFWTMYFSLNFLEKNCPLPNFSSLFFQCRHKLVNSGNKI